MIIKNKSVLILLVFLFLTGCICGGGDSDVKKDSVYNLVIETTDISANFTTTQNSTPIVKNINNNFVHTFIFPVGTDVCIKVTPPTGYAFTGFSGESSNILLANRVAMNSNINLIALFEPIKRVKWNLANQHFIERRGLATIEHESKLYIIGGMSDDLYLNDVWESSDGVKWSIVRNHDDPNGFTGRAYHSALSFDGVMYVICGMEIVDETTFALSDVWKSVDNGKTWSQIAVTGVPHRYLHTSLIFDNKMWVIAGWSGIDLKSVFWSSDGITWTQSTDNAGFGGRSSHSSCVFGGKMWILGGGPDTDAYKNDVWSSDNGITWTKESDASFGGRRLHSSVVFNSKIYIIGGMGSSDISQNDIWSSSDGIAWTSEGNASFSARFSFSAVNFNNKISIIGGKDSFSALSDNNDVYQSVDGSTFIKAENNMFSTNSYGAGSVSYNNKLYLLCGSNRNLITGKIWSSTDGISWTNISTIPLITPRRWVGSAVFNNSMWILGGVGIDYYNDVLFSIDGITWEIAQNDGVTNSFSKRYGHECIYCDESLYLMGGVHENTLFNDFFRTGNGIFWVKLKDSDTNGFSKRYDFATVCFKNTIFIYGGFTETGHSNDIWFYDKTNTEWVQASDDAAFSPRRGHKAFVWDNKVWVAGGFNNNCTQVCGYFNDIYYSYDGVHFVKANITNSFYPRYLMSISVNNNTPWLIGGKYSEYYYFYDSWYMNYN